MFRMNDDQQNYRSLGLGLGLGLGGLLPDLGGDRGVATYAAPAGTPEYYLVKTGMSVAIKPKPGDHDRRNVMVHYGLGKHNVARVLHELKHPLTGAPVSAGELASLVFFRTQYTVEGVQHPAKEVSKQGIAGVGNTREIPLDGPSVQWVWLEATCWIPGFTYRNLQLRCTPSSQT